MINKLRLMVSRAILKLVDDAKQLQELQVSMLDGEARNIVERFQDYGFTSVPFAEAEAIALAVGGSRSHMVVLAVDDRRYRKRDMEEGEVALYTDEGDYIILKRDRIIEVKAGEKLLVDAPEAEFTGNVHVAGNITCDGDVSDANGSMQEMRDIFNAHTHSGVQTGGGNTGDPNTDMT